jgi:hypothetical protein
LERRAEREQSERAGGRPLFTEGNEMERRVCCHNSWQQSSWQLAAGFIRLCRPEPGDLSPRFHAIRRFYAIPAIQADASSIHATWTGQIALSPRTCRFQPTTARLKPLLSTTKSYGLLTESQSDSSGLVGLSQGIYPRG